MMTLRAARKRAVETIKLWGWEMLKIEELYLFLRCASIGKQPEFYKVLVATFSHLRNKILHFGLEALIELLASDYRLIS